MAILSTLKHLSWGEKKLLIFYSIFLFVLFFYSFTQIDLSLTFSRIEFFQQIVKSFQYVGYFNRPLSTYIFIFLVIALLSFYLYFLIKAYAGKLHKKFVWVLVGATACILTFSYNAFSYDLFNYIFDAKIITQYNQNPYEHKALDYAGDPMLSFMRWTHRVYPYGPGWLAMTTPLSFLGFQYFLPTFFFFKLLMAASFVGSAYFIGKILQKIKPERELFGVVFFALNPLVLIEAVVSAHLDIVMIFFVLWSFYLFLIKKYNASVILFIFSVSIKFATGFLLPVYAYLLYATFKNKKIHWKMVFLTATILMCATVYVASTRSNFQPWYLLLPLAFAVFVAEGFYILLPAIIISSFALLTYVPFLFVGNWDNPIPQILMNLYLLSYFISFVSVAIYYGIMDKRIVGLPTRIRLAFFRKR